MLEKKIAESLDLLSKAEETALRMNPEEGFFLGFSGGKDSQAVYHLCKLAGVAFQAYYSVTGIDTPETIRFIRENYPDVKFIHHKKNFFQLVEEKGLPTITRRYCCERLKEHFGAGQCVLTGVRAEESKKRSSYAAIEIFSRRKEHQGQSRKRDETWLAQEEHQCIKGQDKIMVRPILNWKTEDVFQFLIFVGAKVNPTYAKHKRVGCMFCPFAPKYENEYFEKVYPGYRRRLLLAIERWGKKNGYYGLSSAEEVLQWWKTKQSIANYKMRDIASPLID